MRMLTRNLKTVWYALYKNDADVTVTDEYGNTLMTGEHALSYYTPVKLKASVSPANGTAQAEVFGNSISYSRVMIVDDPKCPIDESSILWVDSDGPKYDSANNPVYDYRVVAVARSLNNVSYALSKREVS